MPRPMILSILIPSIPSRQDKLYVLLRELERQQMNLVTTHPTLPTVDIVIDNGSSFRDGGLSIGKKRDGLVRRALGRYLCFLDDDESIAPNYLESLVRMCMQCSDVVTFRAMVNMNNFWALVDMRLAYKVNDQMTPEYTVRRPPWHICPVKSEYAKLYDFND